VFSFELTGAAVTPAAIQSYLGRLKEDAENTGDQREMKKAKLTASFLDTLSSLASDSDDVLDRQFIMEAFRDLWRGVQAGQVPVLPSEYDPIDEDSDEDNGNGVDSGERDGAENGDGEEDGGGTGSGEEDGGGVGSGQEGGGGAGSDEGEDGDMS
jgi:hypothetical protein